MTPDDVYPEHEKLSSVQEEFNALVEFLDEWCGQKNLALCQLFDSGKLLGFGSEVVMEYQAVFDVKSLVYEFLDVDPKELEQDRRRMLDALRARTS